MNHCIAKIQSIVSEGRGDRRSVFQLGYNLGRLSELTGLGRGPFWDRWKGAVEAWDLPQLRQLAQDLPMFSGISPSPEETSPRTSSPEPERA